MKYKVRYSRQAIRELDRVWAEVYEASKSAETAEQYVNDLLDRVEDKADFPKSGSPLYYQDSFTGYYFVVFKAYLAFYRLENDVLLIDRVLFGRSDYMRYLHLGTDQ
jgi:plasmid stabilization system protein ParE